MLFCFVKPSYAEKNYETWLDSIDTSKINSYSEEMLIRGWFFHKTKNVEKLELYIDNQWVANIDYGIERKDVFNAYSDNKQSLNSGFEMTYQLDEISMGNHSFSIIAITESGEEYEIATGQFLKEDIYFSWIDFPTTNSIKLKNENLEINGWIFNSSGIEMVNIYLDDKLLGTANYGIHRVDVLSAYPSYNNAEYSGFEFNHPSDNIEFGTHTIRIEVESHDGIVEEITTIALTKQKDHTLGYVALIVLLFYTAAFVLIRKKSNYIIQEKWLHSIKSRIDIIWFQLSLSIKVLAFANISNIYIDNFTWLTNAAVLLLIALLLSLIRKFKIRFSILFFINLLITIIIYSDIVYLRYFDDVTSVIVLTYVSQVTELGGSIIELLKIGDVYLFLDLILIIILFFINIKPINVNLRIKILYLIMVGITLIPITITVKNIYSDESNLFKQTFSNKEVVKELGVLNYHIFDVMKNINILVKRPILTAEEEKKINDWLNEHTIYNSEAPLYGVAKDKNLILIQEESLQSFVIGLKIDGQEITPNINNLLKESIYFENFYDQTYNGRTSDGELTALTSLYPLREGTANFRYPNTQVDTLPKVLKSKGYNTRSFHAFKGEFWNRQVMHSNYGFEQSMFYNDFSQTEQIGWGLSDEHFFKQSVKEMKYSEQPFFSFLISLTTHHPYDGIPNKYKNLDLGELENSLMGDYLHSVHYADYSIKTLIEELKSSGIYENSIIAIYGDHDAGIDPDEIRKVLGTKLSSDILYDKIPFIIHIPNIDKVTEKEISGQLDITPTLLHLLGIPARNYSFMGYNLLLDNVNKLVAFRGGKFVTNDLIYDNVCIRPSGEIKVEIKECEIIIEEMNKRFTISDLLIKSDLQND